MHISSMAHGSKLIGLLYACYRLNERHYGKRDFLRENFRGTMSTSLPTKLCSNLHLTFLSDVLKFELFS